MPLTTPPGGSGEGTFYAYAYPESAGFGRYPVRPESASYDPGSGEFVLPYEVVRTAADPEGVLLEFLQTSYEAAAVSVATGTAQLSSGMTPATAECITPYTARCGRISGSSVSSSHME